MKYFLDTEFHEDGRTIDLISIGIVDLGGQEFYAVNADCDFDRIDALDSCAWLRKNVMPSIDVRSAIPKSEIRRGILEFVQDNAQFYGWYADYDWVALCQLFGRMIDLPHGWPMFCNDLKQTCNERGIVLPKQREGLHNALEDARWVRKSYLHIESL